MRELSTLTKAPRVERVQPKNGKLDVVDPNASPTFAILGGHGNEYSVSTLFYPAAMANIQRKIPNAKFIAVDQIVNTSGGGKRIADQAREFERHGFKYEESLHPDEFYRRLANGSLHVDGSVLAIPVKHHLPETKRLLDATGQPIMVEKPLGLPGEEVTFRELHRQNPGRIYAADFSNGTDSLNYALKSGIFDEIGKVKSIIGRFVEEQSIEDLVSAVRDRKLLRALAEIT